MVLMYNCVLLPAQAYMLSTQYSSMSSVVSAYSRSFCTLPHFFKYRCSNLILPSAEQDE